MDRRDTPWILIVDDVETNRFVLRNIITDMGLQPILAENGVQALRIVERHRPQLILLDVSMPEMDGYEFCRLMKEDPVTRDIPIIFISAYDEPDDIITGFSLGGEDYITKPFNPLEVIARVKAQLRRYAYLGGMEQKPPKAFAIGGIELDDEGKTVTLNGEEVALTPTEYDILKLFLANPGKVFSSKEIYSAVWDSDPMGAEGTIAVHIRHLREKLEIDPANPRYLKVVWGKGYKMEDKK